MKGLKQLYGKTIIDCRDSDELDIGYKVELEYYKTRNSIAVMEDVKPYGLEIIKKQEKNEIINIEKKIVNNIFSKENDANKLLEILVNNKVTPIIIDDVLQDILKTKAI